MWILIVLTLNLGTPVTISAPQFMYEQECKAAAQWIEQSAQQHVPPAYGLQARCFKTN
jgi:hypothetical protein